jgi:hypothetical protein
VTIPPGPNASPAAAGGGPFRSGGFTARFKCPAAERALRGMKRTAQSTLLKLHVSVEVEYNPASHKGG